MGRFTSGLRLVTRTAIAGLFHVAPRLRYAVEVHGVAHDPGGPGTYLAISHKRDLDSVVPLPTVGFHRGRRALAGEIHFVLRADAFTPGFLARLVPRPRWLARGLRPLTRAPVLDWLGGHPLMDLHRRPAEEWLREALQIEGGGRAGDSVAPALLRELAMAAGEPPDQVAERPLSQLFAWR